jgi:hypothetical protein
VPFDKSSLCETKANFTPHAENVYGLKREKGLDFCR